MSESFDYIIVGAGSAGCAIANRLSEDPDVSVLLLEAGPYPASLWTKMPAGLSKALRDPQLVWRDATESVASLAQRRIPWPHGRTLGGSSAVNGMVYSRGAPHDYDAWAAAGNEGWSWADVKPIFESFELRCDRDEPFRANALGVSRIAIETAGIDAFVKAGLALGLAHSEEPDRSDAVCIGRALTTTLHGRRHSTASAFLFPARQRKNLNVRVNATVHRIAMNAGRAEAIVYAQGTTQITVHCRREVIVCAGAINTPHLLLLSGIGPAEHLRQFGIDVVVDARGVGANLHDHSILNLAATVEPALSINRELRGWRMLMNGARWLLTQRGPMAVGASQAYAFVRSDVTQSVPDLQINFRPFTFSLNRAGTVVVDKNPGVGLATAHLHPRSRGRILLSSADPRERPAIQYDVLAAPEDLQAHVSGVQWMRRLLTAEPLAAGLRAEIAPGVNVQSDADIERYIRSALGSMGHPVGSCRMGSDDDAVVDAKLRVRGTQNLRIADASIMPAITSANTNGPCIMIGMKCAALLLGK